MPDVDGYEFLRQLKKLPGLDGIPAIAVSGYASEDDRERALSVGYLTLIPKPVDVDVLFDLLHDLNLPTAGKKV
jgi:CheY-like chemotaxis protein